MTSSLLPSGAYSSLFTFGHYLQETKQAKKLAPDGSSYSARKERMVISFFFVVLKLPQFLLAQIFCCEKELQATQQMKKATFLGGLVRQNCFVGKFPPTVLKLNTPRNSLSLSTQCVFSRPRKLN